MTTHSEDAEDLRINLRVPAVIAQDFDEIWKQLGYNTRNDAIVDVLRRFVLKEGRKQIDTLERSRAARKHVRPR
jgi:metal-responsive CopG/Arc/MetJ family transcriptional regulator